jgi:hypothetical protein
MGKNKISDCGFGISDWEKTTASCAPEFLDELARQAFL